MIDGKAQELEPVELLRGGTIQVAVEGLDSLVALRFPFVPDRAWRRRKDGRASFLLG